MRRAQSVRPNHSGIAIDPRRSWIGLHRCSAIQRDSFRIGIQGHRMCRRFECPNIQVIPEQRSPRPIRDNRTRMSPQLMCRQNRQHEPLRPHRHLHSSSRRARFGARLRVQGNNTRPLNSPRFQSIANPRSSMFERLPHKPASPQKNARGSSYA
jgi:hypothetical protein